VIANGITVITAPGTYNIDLSATRIEVNAAGSVTLNLPSAVDPGAPAITVPGGYTKNSILILDAGGHSSTFPITVQPQAGENIGGSGSFTIMQNFTGVILIPSSLMHGWSGVVVNTVFATTTDPLFLVNGLSLNATNPTVSGDANDRFGAQFNVAYTWAPTLSVPQFTDENAVEINLTNYSGMNVYGGGQAPIGSLGTLVGGTGYTNGSYTGVALTGGSGVNATANVTVAGGVVTVATLNAAGIGYSPNDVLGFSGIGAGTGAYVFIGSMGSGIHTQGKKTQFPLLLTQTAYGSGQRFVYGATLNAYGASDSFIASEALRFCSGPIGGDEGAGWRSVSYCLQGVDALVLGQVTAVTRTAYSARTTQIVNGSNVVQAVTVSTTTGANVGDWICVGQTTGPSPNMEGVQITAVGAGTISGVFRTNQASGTSLTPALVMTVTNLIGAGEGRYLINLSGASYTTGMVSAIAGGGFTGTGTTWTPTMVGGNVGNIGAIALNADTYTGAPYNGSPGTNTGPLYSWYRIGSTPTNTSLGIVSYSVAGDAGYRGYGAPGPGANNTYVIRPSALILNFLPTFGQIVCETSTATWTVGDTYECALTPYPDVTGFQYHMATYTAGPTNRAFMQVINTGPRAFQQGIALVNGQSGGYLGSNADTWSWGTAFVVDNCQVGLAVGNCSTTAISLTSAAAGGRSTDAGGGIKWGGQILQPNTPNSGMDFQMITTGTGGMLKSISNTVNSDGSQCELHWQGYLQVGGPGSISYIRLGGVNTAGGSIDKTIDIKNYTSGAGPVSGKQLDFIINDLVSAITWYPFSLSNNTVAVGPLLSQACVSNTTNNPSTDLQLSNQVWTGSVAANHFGRINVMPGSGVNNAPVTMRFSVIGPIGSYNASFPDIPMTVREDGYFSIGKRNDGATINDTLSLDPTGLTANRIVTVPDQAGGLCIVSPTVTTPASHSAAGMPGQVVYDATNLYVCVATNLWIRCAGSTTF
jgi:hypothetical protein